jgi:hypothetical protein
VSAQFSQIGQKKRPRRGREGVFETTSLRTTWLKYVFQMFVAYIETYYYYYYYQEHIFVICVFSFLFVVFSVLSHFKCSVQYRPKALKRSVFVSGVAGKD